MTAPGRIYEAMPHILARSVVLSQYRAIAEQLGYPPRRRDLLVLNREDLLLSIMRRFGTVRALRQELISSFTPAAPRPPPAMNVLDQRRPIEDRVALVYQAFVENGRRLNLTATALSRSRIQVRAYLNRGVELGLLNAADVVSARLRKPQPATPPSDSQTVPRKRLAMAAYLELSRELGRPATSHDIQAVRPGIYKTIRQEYGGMPAFYAALKREHGILVQPKRRIRT